MSKWEHLFINGEFSPRDRLLSGLTQRQVAARPPGASHSISQELWHPAKWQTSIVRRDGTAAAEWVAGGQRFPPGTSVTELMWREIVVEFLDGAQKAVEWGNSPKELARELKPGVTLGDALQSLAVHNAYHLGKIVALRQMIGAWPPIA